ncbi:hypothetical protein [uncultured Kordia sp.]|uniref:hypothetical protein n=1 Tax=uncultured Kordia sp. TaxID=507699 RepID=UPI002605EBB7|nr:hypothetical protein [uncultured Kordia sp.]
MNRIIYLILVSLCLQTACRHKETSKKEIEELYQKFLEKKVPKLDIDLKVCNDCYSMHEIRQFEQSLGALEIKLTAKELVDIFVTCYPYTRSNNFNYGDFSKNSYSNWLNLKKIIRPDQYVIFQRPLTKNMPFKHIIIYSTYNNVINIELKNGEKSSKGSYKMFSKYFFKIYETDQHLDTNFPYNDTPYLDYSKYKREFSIYSYIGAYMSLYNQLEAKEYLSKEMKKHAFRYEEYHGYKKKKPFKRLNFLTATIESRETEYIKKNYKADGANYFYQESEIFHEINRLHWVTSENFNHYGEYSQHQQISLDYANCKETQNSQTLKDIAIYLKFGRDEMRNKEWLSFSFEEKLQRLNEEEQKNLLQLKRDTAFTIIDI